jgi:hypothetical protein
MFPATRQIHPPGIEEKSLIKDSALEFTADFHGVAR